MGPTCDDLTKNVWRRLSARSWCMTRNSRAHPALWQGHWPPFDGRITFSRPWCPRAATILANDWGCTRLHLGRETASTSSCSRPSQRVRPHVPLSGRALSPAAV
ncbi:MAG: hypothetical protein V8S34_08695 [Lawsonibacter sp.]